MNDPQGSLWRRWDLQVHTPASVLNNQFGDDWDLYVHALFSAAVAKNVAVVGITDYFCVEGYRRLHEKYLDNQTELRRLFAAEIASDADYLLKVRSITVLANVEFRLNVSIEKGGGKKLNMHVLFSEDLTAQQIEDNFLSQLQFTFEGIRQDRNDTRPLNRANLEDLGRKRKEHFPELLGSDMYQGCNAAWIDDEQISNVLTANGLFRNRYAVVLAEELTSDLHWLSQSGHLRAVLVEKSDAIFSGSDKTRAWALSSEFADRFGACKPCLWGSDAHMLERLFEPDQQRYCWIKADPQFAGLRQVFNEPEARTYVGPSPTLLDEITHQKRIFIQSIAISKKTASSLREKWFDGTALHLNPELVAIIGNKGSGKSALADTLALMGGCQLSEDEYGFLRPKRFRAKDATGKIDRSGEFEATVTWSNGEISPLRSLASTVSAGEVERVKYLPQGYLERICNERDAKSFRDFEQELDRVIFSHVPSADRLGRTTLGELLDDETVESKRSRSALKVRLRELNLRIAGWEDRLSAEARSRIEQRISSRLKEIEALDKVKPAPVPPPSDDDGVLATMAAVNLELNRLSGITADLDNQFRDATKLQGRVKQEAADSRKLHQRIESFQTQFTTMVSELAPLAERVGLKINDLVQLRVDLAPVTAILHAKDVEAEKLKEATDPFEGNSLPNRIKNVQQEVTEKRAQLDLPNQQYQAYVKERDSWQGRREELVGSTDDQDSLVWLQDQLSFLDDILPEQLIGSKEQRIVLVEAIFAEIAREAQKYRHYYEPAQQAIEAHRLVDSEFDIRFLVAITCRNIADEFFGLVAQNKAGSFYGTEEGRRRLRDMTAAADFETVEGLRAFLAAIEVALASDLRDQARPAVTLARQMKREKSPKEFYDFLYSLDYLEPRYELRLGARTLQELSPGERGLMLLIFYLAIDDDRMPLIIDQPEENLDNSSVKRYLVPCIRHAKKRRQLFIVTHNPNLAVVCDAEQVIHARINKSDGNHVEYEAGSIEHSPTNLNLLNVLEGTKVAFESRRAKYRAGGSL
jgi:ABC-type lipoprotein export system ATPase subunit